MDREIYPNKVIVIAYACNPFHGSEDGVGWGWLKMIAKTSDVWVILASFHRKDVERYCAMYPNDCINMHFCYVDHRPWHYSPTKNWVRIENSLLKPIMNYAYRLWQRDAFQLAKELHKVQKFDLCHLITYVGFRFPGHFWVLDMPFVWGPIGGLENTPWRFLPAMGLYGCVYYAGRNIINSMHRVLLSAPRKAFAKAGPGVIAATEGIRREIKRWYGVDSHIICEIGPPPEVADGIITRVQGETFRLAWSGEHLPGKALPLLLQSLANLPDQVKWTLDILGDGPCNRKWKAMAERLGIASRCRWHGLVTRHQAISIVHSSHVFVITSLKDLTSSVLLEALSQGVPVVCPAHCGFSNVVTATCGIKLPLQSPQQFSAALTEAIAALVEDESRRRLLAQGALDRIKDYSWDSKAKELDKIYCDALSGSSHA